MRNYLDGHFIQTGDIDLTIEPSEQTWIPIGNCDDPFTGTFNGGRYVIENMKVYNPDANCQGLFGYLEGATVKNTNVNDADVSGNRYTGILAGYAGNSVIENVHVNGEITGHDRTGGLVGQLGGESSLHYTSADVSVKGTNSTGGLVGYVGISDVTIYHSHTTGTVQGNDDVGGLMGYNYYRGLIADSYSHASVHGKNNVGGLVGRTYSTGGDIYRSYSTGRVTGDGDNVGGFLGRWQFFYGGAVFVDCYWDIQTSGQQESAGGDGVAGLSTTEMQQQETYHNFNFYNLWEINEGSGYPVFRDISMYDRLVEVTLDELQGDGSAENPWFIGDAHQLNAMHKDLSAHYRLKSDIDMTGSVAWNEGTGWIPLGTPEDDEGGEAFSGTLDGNGYSINYLTANRPVTEYQGLFGYIENGKAQDLGLEYASVQGNRYTGILAGYAGNSVIENVHVNGEITGHDRTGGLVGQLGGESSLHYTSADVSVKGANSTGGLVGYVGISDVTIYHSHTTGAVQGNDDVGGLMGYNYYRGLIADSYSHASVHGKNNVGGLVGRTYSTGGDIYRSYSTGRVTGDGDNVGGFLGRWQFFYGGAVFVDCYWDIQTSGQQESAGGDGVAGLSTTEMQQQETYHNFNFYNLWEINEGSGYPVFRDISMYDRLVEVTLDELQGDGSAENPWLIGDAHQLNAMHKDLSAHYRLKSDIDMTGSVAWNEGTGWIPLGTPEDDEEGEAFTGTLDGNGYSINYLTVNRPVTEYQGLFGYIENGKVKDLELEYASVQGNHYTGGLAGSAYESDLENIQIMGEINGHDRTGGLVGQLGGESSLKYASADVSVKGGSSTGGLVGYSPGSDLVISKSYSVGRVQGNDEVGGLKGYSYRKGIIADSYSRATVHGKNNVGGLVGRTYSTGGDIYRSYSTGRVTGDGDNVGGFLGRWQFFYGAAAIVDCYWDIQTSGQQESMGGAGVTGLSTQEMTFPYGEGVYEEWDFEEVWTDDADFVVNDGYPYLKQNAPIDLDAEEELAGRELPREASLSQNYPNPFNPVTNMVFELPADSDVRLEVFDSIGRRVAVLLDERIAAGRHTVSFDASGLASGIYISRLQVSSSSGESAGSSTRVHARTMTLVK